MIDDCGPVISKTWTMPPYRHRPGLTVKPEDGPAHAMARCAPGKLDPDDWRANDAYLYGFLLYRDGYYWEAHEVWEAVWKSCAPNSRERRLLQALIQLANAQLKADLGRAAAAVRIQTDVAALLQDAMASPAADQDDAQLLGVSVKRLLRQVENALP